MDTDILNDAGTVTTNLDTLLETGDHTGRPFNVLVGSNMGNRTLIMSVPMHTFYEISEVANKQNLAAIPAYADQPVAQRRLDEAHAKKLAIFILKGLLDVARRQLEKAEQPVPDVLKRMQKEIGSQPYISMQPITANIRNCKFGGEGLRFERSGGVITVYLSDKHVLWVIDGQHRRFAMEMVFDFLKAVLNNNRYPRKPVLYVPTDDPKREPTAEEMKLWATTFEIARSGCSIVVEAHLGLDIDQERQLFHDLNNLGKNVEGGLAYEFDNSNPVNRFIKEHLIGDGLLTATVVESDSTGDWAKDEGVIARKDLVAINALLFLNKTTINGATPADINSKYDYANRFWNAIGQIPNWGEPGAKKNTVAAQPAVLKTLAKLAYDFGYGRDQNSEYLERLFTAIEEGDIDFSHSNPMWRYYEMSPEERERFCPGMADAVTPEDAGINLDLGSYDAANRLMRFGPKHNDIQRHLGDMIRFKLGLPKRKALEKLQMEMDARRILDGLLEKGELPEV